MTCRNWSLRTTVVGGFSLVLTLSAIPCFASAKNGKLFAQKVLEETLPQHPEVSGLEMSAATKQGCKTIASTDPKDLGEKCDKDEFEPMRTGKPYVENESGGFDVTLPFRDAKGTIIAVVGMDFKPEPGQTKERVLKQGSRIVSEMEKQIPSKAQMFAKEK